MTVTASILIVTGGRKELLERCLRSVRCELEGFPKEIVIVVNGDAETSPIPPNISIPVKFKRSPRVTPAAARNLGLSLVTGDYVCFLDDDVELPSDYFSVAKRVLDAQPGAAVLGGPDATHPEAGNLEKAIGFALKSPLATATTRARHGAANLGLTSADETKLILCNLLLKTDLFTVDGFGFDERFQRNEENVLLFQLKDKAILFCSDLFVYHRRKTHLAHFCKAVAGSGYHRARSILLYPESTNPLFFLPTVFLGYLISLTIIRSEIALAPLLAYLILNLVFAVRISLREGMPHLFPGVVLYQLLITIAYGSGFLSGLVAKEPNSRCDTVAATKRLR